MRLASLACARSIRSSPASFALAMVPTMMMREPSMRTEKKMPTSGLAKATEAASSKPSNVAMTGKRAAPMVKEMRPSRALSGILLPSPRMFAKPLISSGPSVSREGPHCRTAGFLSMTSSASSLPIISKRTSFERSRVLQNVYDGLIICGLEKTASRASASLPYAATSAPQSCSSCCRVYSFLNLCVTSTMSAGSRLPRTRGGAPLVTVFILLASLISFTLAKNCIRGAGDRGCAAAAGEYAPTAAAPAVGAAERRSTAGAWSSDSRSGATKSIASVWSSSQSAQQCRRV
mmetsp:Transcript_4103/g.12037  ORF Transcript_4103/g.12037 Transcript_4103/m.12037 type:complete len:290 (-) Transcript_4103:21-890(-)